MKRTLLLLSVVVAFLCLTAFTYHQLNPEEPHHALTISAIEPAILIPPPTIATTTTTTISSTTTSSPVHSTTTARPADQPKPAATGGTQPSPYRGVGGPYTAPGGCMVDAPHPVAQAHACWDNLIARYSWPTARVFSVMMCESRGNPYDIGIPTRYGRAVGLMQDMGGPEDPAANMEVAYQKYKASGWGPWSSSESCWASAQNG